MRAERRELEERRNGQLAKLLDGPLLPGETEEGLAKLKEEDRALAELGLLELRDEDGGVAYKHVDELQPGDRADRVRAEGARVRWITERVNKLQEQRTRRG